MRFLFCLKLILLSDFSWALTYSEAKAKLQTYLVKDPSIQDYYELTENAFILYSSPQEKGGKKPEQIIDLAKLPAPTPHLRSSLFGKRIAIDPGHFGGPLAKLEERFVELPGINFDEGTLTLMTAKVLRQMLEKEGAIVLLTKEHLGEGVYTTDFFLWLKKHPEYHRLPLAQTFRTYYNPLDLKARARKIASFQPDLTLIIHYNAHQTILKAPTTINYNMAFVGGGFCKGELKTQEDRLAFARMLTSNDLEESQRLSSLVIAAFEKHLSVPAVDDSLHLGYLDKCSLKIENGVYARNLRLTRLIPGPLCYGESLCQDNEKESLLLTKRDFEIEGIHGPSRVKDVANAYFEAIQSFFN